MNLLTSVLAFVLIPVFFMALHWAGVLVRALTGGKLPSLLGSLVVLVALVVIAPVVFEAAGRTVEGHIISKNESIETGYYGVTVPVYHHFDVLIGVAGSAQPLNLELSASTFDQLHEGEEVALRLITLGPIRIARLARGSWLASLPLFELERLLFASAWLLTIVALLAAPALFHFGTTGRAVIISVVLSAFLSDAFLLRAWWEPRQVIAIAEVQSVRTVRSADILNWFGSNPASSGNAVHVTLPQAYDEVQLAYRPAPNRSVAIAVDRVDSRTAEPLSKGRKVEIAYWSPDPRSARMTRGKRTYAWRNSAAVYGAEFVVLALALAFAGAASAFGDRLRDAASSVRARVRPRKPS